MKFLTGLLVFAFALGAHTQEDTFRSVQNELGHVHFFFEELMGLNRNALSAYIYTLTNIALRSHLDTYEFIFTRGSEARDIINGLTPENEIEEACIDRMRTRFELQKLRFGQRLARCVGTVHDILLQWNTFVNNVHQEGQQQAAAVQNIGFNLFARTQVFDGPEHLPTTMKTDLRNLIFRALGLVESVEEFIQNIADNIGDIEFDFIRCDKELEEAAVREIEFEISGARACVGEGGDPITPTPLYD